MAKLTTGWRRSSSDTSLLWLVAVSVALLAAYWNDLSVVGSFWENPEYSHGYLIPFFALLILGMRRPAGQNSIPWDRTDGYAAIFFKALKGRPLDVAGVALVAVSAVVICVVEWAFDESPSKYAILPIGLALGLAGGLLLTRPDFSAADTTSGRWWGVGLLALACVARLWSTEHFAGWPSRYSYVLAMAGVFLMVYGWSGLRWSWPSIGLMFLMFPFPDPVRRAALEPLQAIATQSSTYLLQTIGIAAYCDGNQIRIGDAAQPLSVVEQCSGLRMLTIFFSLTIVAALLILKDRPLWERLTVVASAAPIALTVNILRITLAGVMFNFAEAGVTIFGAPITHEVAHRVFHDWAGLLMPPVALGMLYLELRILPRIFIEVEDSDLRVPDFAAPRRDHERHAASAGS